MPNEIPSYVTMNLPSWFWGGNPNEFFKSAEIYARSDSTGGNWRVRTESSYRAVAPSLVTVQTLSTSKRQEIEINRINVIPEDDAFYEDGPNREHALSRLAEIVDRASVGDDPYNWLYAYKMQTMLAKPGELQPTVSSCCRAIQNCRAEPDDAPAFPDLSIHAISRRPALSYRIKAASLLVGAEYDAQLQAFGNAGRDLRAILESGQPLFPSSGYIADGTTLLDTYVGPLQGATSPMIWSVGASRSFGLILYSLGRTIGRRRDSLTDPLHLLPYEGPLLPTSQAQLSPESCQASVEWWIGRLNEILDILSNPAVFSDKREIYNPLKHLQAITTVEQLFRRVIALQAVYYNAEARLPIFFSALDIYSRITGHSIVQQCNLRKASNVLDQLRMKIPAPVAELLLPNAQRAVDALKEVQDGFYMLHSTGSSRMPVLDAASQSFLDIEEAAAEYIEMRRNSTHGFGTNKPGKVAITNALLAHHNGKLPHDLPLLAYLYLLDILTNPKRLERQLYKSGNT